MISKVTEMQTIPFSLHFSNFPSQRRRVRRGYGFERQTLLSVWPVEWGHGSANNAVTSITHKNPNGTQIVQHSYTYDNTNNIVEYLNSIDGSTTYNYDFLGQLIGADYANGSISDENYTYDENGNRITANGDTYTTGDNNELTSDGTWTYTYDAEGNRISKTNATNRELYTWDYRNRLTTVTQQEWDSVEQDWTTTQIVEYAYDYNNVWIRKVIGTDKTIFIPENYQTTVQIDNNAVMHHYLWTPNQQDKLLADITPNSTSWALTDHLGTIRDVLGATTTHLIYDAFGNLTSGTNPLLFGYTGKAFDSATNLQNNINRWYDATTGRWLSTDPIGFEANDSNLYRYAHNNTISSLDYNGLVEYTDYIIQSIPSINLEIFSGIILRSSETSFPKTQSEWGQSSCYNIDYTYTIDHIFKLYYPDLTNMDSIFSSTFKKKSREYIENLQFLHLHRSGECKNCKNIEYVKNEDYKIQYVRQKLIFSMKDDLKKPVTIVVTAIFGTTMSYEGWVGECC